MFTIIILILLFVVSILYYKYSEHRKKWRVIEEIPGPPNYPVIGNIWMLGLISRTKRIERMDSLEKKYGKIYKLWRGSTPVIICSSAEDTEIILSSRKNIEKGSAYAPLIPWLGTGLLISGGSKWHQRRKLLTPTFHFSILESFLPIIVEHSKTLVEKLKYLQNEANEWNIYPFINRCSLDIICETAMGIKINVQSQAESSEYLQHVTNMGKIFMAKLLKPWYQNRYFYSFSNMYEKEKKALRILHDTSMNVIQRNKQNRHQEKSTNKERNADKDCDVKSRKKIFLDLLLDASENESITLTDEDIREEVDTFMFEGHDTTTSAITSTIHFLSTNPEVQEKIAEELVSVFGDSDRDPTSDDISKLRYLTSVIKESHRLLPPVPVISRQLSESIILGGKYVIPADTIVTLRMFGIHRQRKYFPNPGKFEPDNFAFENARGRHPFAFTPFSAGPRNCIGQKFAMLEEKVVLSSLLRNYEIKSNQKTEDLGLFVELVLRHENGVRVSITPRIWKK